VKRQKTIRLGPITATFKLTKMKVSRIQRGLSQEQVGSAVGVSAALVSFIENDRYKPSDDIARRIAKLLRIPRSQIQMGMKLK
jgi:putative transcriptional regulator